MLKRKEREKIRRHRFVEKKTTWQQSGQISANWLSGCRVGVKKGEVRTGR